MKISENPLKKLCQLFTVRLVLVTIKLWPGEARSYFWKVLQHFVCTSGDCPAVMATRVIWLPRYSEWTYLVQRRSDGFLSSSLFKMSADLWVFFTVPSIERGLPLTELCTWLLNNDHQLTLKELILYIFIQVFIPYLWLTINIRFFSLSNNPFFTLGYHGEEINRDLTVMFKWELC